MRKTLTRAFGAALAATVLVGVADAQTYMYRYKPALNAPISNDDTTPDPFTIGGAANQPANTLIGSAFVWPTGFTAPTTITVTGDGNPTVSIELGPFVPSGTIAPGQRFVVALTTGAPDGGTSTATVTIGGVSATFSLTRIDTVPNAFAFTDLTGQAANQLVTSAAVTPTGYTTAASVSVSGDGSPQIEVNGNGVWTTSATISPGQSLRVRLTSGAAGTTRNATITVGGVSDTWSVGVASGPVHAGRSCLEAYNSGNRTNGVYTISPNGSTIPVYCDMTGGGWTLVAVQQASYGALMTSAAVGTISSPSQTAAAKIADSDWTAIGTVTRFEIAGGETFYANWGGASYSNSQNYGCDGCNPTPMCSANGSSWSAGRHFHVADCLGVVNSIGFNVGGNWSASMNMAGGRAWAK